LAPDSRFFAGMPWSAVQNGSLPDKMYALAKPPSINSANASTISERTITAETPISARESRSFAPESPRRRPASGNWIQDHPAVRKERHEQPEHATHDDGRGLPVLNMHP